MRYARMLATAIVSRLGAPDWVVASVNHYSHETYEITKEQTLILQIKLESLSGKYGGATVFFPTGIPLEHAILQTADQIQQEAVETIPGAALPPCPGHAHPLTPRLIDNVPMWVCMKEGPEHYSSKIAPTPSGN